MYIIYIYTSPVCCHLFPQSTPSAMKDATNHLVPHNQEYTHSKKHTILNYTVLQYLSGIHNPSQMENNPLPMIFRESSGDGEPGEPLALDLIRFWIKWSNHPKKSTKPQEKWWKKLQKIQKLHCSTAQLFFPCISLAHRVTQFQSITASRHLEALEPQR